EEPAAPVAGVARDLRGCEYVTVAHQPHVRRSHVESDLEHIAVFDDVVLAFDAHPSLLLRLRPGSDVEELAPLDHLGADEAALQVGVDHARALGRARAGAERPRARLLLAGRQERPPPEEVVRRATHAWH